MKPLSIFILLGCALIGTGCSDPLEQRTPDEVRGQLQRGLTGQGKLGPMDRPEGDQAEEHGVPQTHP
jgi:hypothetical protein